MADQVLRLQAEMWGLDRKVMRAYRQAALMQNMISIVEIRQGRALGDRQQSFVSSQQNQLVTLRSALVMYKSYIQEVVGRMVETEERMLALGGGRAVLYHWDL